MWTEHRRVRRLAIAAVIGASLGLGCAAPAGPPPIRVGAVCTTCGMRVEDVRFACERGSANRWRVFDSIECLLRDSLGSESDVLTDWDSRSLHRADSLWVVQGSLPSPMGGGYAAFLDRASADEAAARRSGRVARLADYRAGGSTR